MDTNPYTDLDTSNIKTLDTAAAQSFSQSQPTDMDTNRHTDMDTSKARPQDTTAQSSGLRTVPADPQSSVSSVHTVDECIQERYENTVEKGDGIVCVSASSQAEQLEQNEAELRSRDAHIKILKNKLVAPKMLHSKEKKQLQEHSKELLKEANALRHCRIAPQPMCVFKKVNGRTHQIFREWSGGVKTDWTVPFDLVQIHVKEWQAWAAQEEHCKLIELLRQLEEKKTEVAQMQNNAKVAATEIATLHNNAKLMQVEIETLKCSIRDC